MERFSELRSALSSFPVALSSAGWAMPLDEERYHMEYYHPPHGYPKSLKRDFAAVYGFHDNDGWLKVGKAGPGSDNRFRYQHYKPGSAASTLADTLRREGWYERDEVTPRDEILSRTGRFNVFVHRSLGEFFLGFLESFLILRLRPRFEGHAWK